MSEDLARKARVAALAMLARREYSAQELAVKLAKKGFESPLVERVLARLSSEGLQSDERFAETYIYSQIGKGIGPLRIRLQLQQRGIGEEVISALLADVDDAWQQRARQVRSKRFGTCLPGSLKEKQRQQRYLQYRGFSFEQIAAALRFSEIDV